MGDFSAVSKGDEKSLAMEELSAASKDEEKSLEELDRLFLVTHTMDKLPEYLLGVCAAVPLDVLDMEDSDLVRVRFFSFKQNTRIPFAFDRTKNLTDSWMS
jgi:hypothetical protein